MGFQISQNLIGTFCIVNEEIKSTVKVMGGEFNRNILYCKCLLKKLFDVSFIVI